jgi:hypothetical protein
MQPGALRRAGKIMTTAPPAIQGTIVDAATQQVTAGAALTLLAAGEDLTTTTSGDDGVFRLFEVDEGVYQLLAGSLTTTVRPMSPITRPCCSQRAQDFGRLFTLIGENDIGVPSLEDVIVKTTTTITDRHRLNLLRVFAPERFSRTVDNVLERPNFQNTLVARTSQDSGLLGMNWRWLTGQSNFMTNTVFFRDSDKRSVQGDTFPELVRCAQDVPIRADILDVREAEREYDWRGDFNYVTGPDDRMTG